MTITNNFETNRFDIDITFERSWLSQFDAADQTTAKLLIDSLLYVSNDHLISGLHDLVFAFVRDVASGPVAIFAARENTGETYWRRDSRPLSVPGRQPVGSEGILSNFCRDLAKSVKGVHDHPSIKQMRKARCRHIICLDDMVGSGSRMVTFAEWLYENKTIRSWHSLNYISFVACTYCTSIVGETKVAQSRLYSSSYQVQSVGNGRSIWTQDQRTAIQDLCQKYAQYTRKPDWPLGFQNAFTAIVFSHKCPNTNPAILWASKRGSWNALFDQRPEFILKGTGRQDRRLRLQERILNALGHTRLTRPSLFGRLNTESRQLLVLLSCLAARRYRDTILSDILESPLPVIRGQIAQCQSYKWIDDTRHLTQLGKDILVAARRNQCIPSKEIELKEDFYYPITLRSPESSPS